MIAWENYSNVNLVGLYKFFFSNCVGKTILQKLTMHKVFSNGLNVIAKLTPYPTLYRQPLPVPFKAIRNSRIGSDLNLQTTRAHSFDYLGSSFFRGSAVRVRH